MGTSVRCLDLRFSVWLWEKKVWRQSEKEYTWRQGRLFLWGKKIVDWQRTSTVVLGFWTTWRERKSPVLRALVRLWECFISFSSFTSSTGTFITYLPRSDNQSGVLNLFIFSLLVSIFLYVITSFPSSKSTEACQTKTACPWWFWRWKRSASNCSEREVRCCPFFFFLLFCCWNGWSFEGSRGNFFTWNHSLFSCFNTALCAVQIYPLRYAAKSSVSFPLLWFLLISAFLAGVQPGVSDLLDLTCS